ncbi:hypothetical protein F5I97DRAFT_777877 [Phlebopus sp. FC_14]|nr:hypothetical protein F5I97DRAFT_777877 [Phlebopus sp. FC_14]
MAMALHQTFPPQRHPTSLPPPARTVPRPSVDARWSQIVPNTECLSCSYDRKRVLLLLCVTGRLRLTYLTQGRRAASGPPMRWGTPQDVHVDAPGVTYMFVYEPVRNDVPTPKSQTTREYTTDSEVCMYSTHTARSTDRPVGASYGVRIRRAPRRLVVLCSTHARTDPLRSPKEPFFFGAGRQLSRRGNTRFRDRHRIIDSYSCRVKKRKALPRASNPLRHTGRDTVSVALNAQTVQLLHAFFSPITKT